MNGWWIALAVWIGVSIPVALVLGRMIRTADRLDRACRELRRTHADDPGTRRLIGPEQRDSA